MRVETLQVACNIYIYIKRFILLSRLECEGELESSRTKSVYTRGIITVEVRMQLVVWWHRTTSKSRVVPSITDFIIYPELALCFFIIFIFIYTSKFESIWKTIKFKYMSIFFYIVLTLIWIFIHDTIWHYTYVILNLILLEYVPHCCARNGHVKCDMILEITVVAT